MYQIIIVVALILVLGFFYLKNNSGTEELSETEIQLWVMIETNDYFITQSEIEIEEDAIALIEGMGLGESDGHSSGAHQFDFNFFNVQNFGKAEIAINELLQSKYPKLNYVISDNYETTFDKVN